MNFITKISILAVVLVLAILAVSAVPTKASELSDYRYLVNHQDTPRNVAAFNDMVYHAGGITNLNMRMDAVNNMTVITVNSYAAYNPATGNVAYTGYWGTN
jgi:hypothetical protein